MFGAMGQTPVNKGLRERKISGDDDEEDELGLKKDAISLDQAS